MTLTLITKMDGASGDIFVQLVKGRLTPEQRQHFRDVFNCDQPDNEDDDDASNMLFREFETGDLLTAKQAVDAGDFVIVNADGEPTPVDPAYAERQL